MSDLNHVDGTGRTISDNEHTISQHEDLTTPNNEDVQVDVERTIEEMEKKFAVHEIVENELIAYALYSQYAGVKVFAVRKGKEVKFYDGSGVQAKEFLCNREGLKDKKRSKDRIPDYRKTESRCNCQAILKVGRTKGGPWVVKTFIKEHNHDMFAPDQAYLLRTSRNVTNEKQLIITTMVNAKIPISRAINVLENVAGGRDKVGFIPKDAYDSVSREKRNLRKTKMENRYSFELMQHLKNKSNKHPDFFWDYELDDDNRLMNFFYRDSRCLEDYGNFNDVVSIDTTYRTNMFDMICAPFVGINHHHENILFGFAILSDETEETFTWLFRKFLESMGEKQPGVVFTDQCRAMMNAVEVVFNKSHHKLCQWHINQNAPSHFGKLNSDSNFKNLWNKCMSYCESEEEFEATWKEMEDKYNVGAISWFTTMYTLRKKWSTAFSNTKFSAGLNTTSRSEGTNSVFKQNIKNKTSTLLECVISYEQVQDDWRLKEKEKDNKPSLFVEHPLLKHAANVYTFNMFKFFEKELKDTMALEIPGKITCDGSQIARYKVKTYDRPWFRTVEYDSHKMEIRCSCHRTETVGILCRHALKVYDVMNMRSIPDKYIIKRWRKREKSEMYFSQSCNMNTLSGNLGESNYIYEMAFVSHATKEFRELAMQGKKHLDTRKIVTKYIEGAKKEMQEWFKKNNISDVVEGDMVTSNTSAVNDDVVVRDPLIAKPRGVRNDHKRHWEEKGKKGKGKAKASEKEKADNATANHTQSSNSWFRYLPTKTKRRAKAMEKEVRTSITRIISERLVSVMGGDKSGEDDFLDLCLNELYNDTQNNTTKYGNVRDAVEDVIAQLKIFLFAGHATSNILVWTLIALATYKEWQARAREEVLYTFGKDATNVEINHDKLNELKNVTMILHEVLRFYPSGTELSRVVEKDTDIGGKLFVPKGIMLQLQISILHQNTEIWGKDALDFKPERFAEGVSKATNGHVAAYMPFGWGPRICIGNKFSLLACKIFLVQVLRTYSFELSPTYKHTPWAAFTIQPQHGAPFVFHKL